MIKRMRISKALMVISLVSLAAFQFWWLRKSYGEEKETLHIRTNILFRETVHKLQVSKMKIDAIMKKKIPSKSDMVGVMNILKEKIRDSASVPPKVKSTLIVSYDKKRMPATPPLPDSAKEATFMHWEGEDEVFNILIATDSLQDSVTLKDVNTAYAKSLKAEGINVPFSVDEVVLPTGLHKQKILVEPKEAEATVGFMRPVTFKLHLGNTTGYLLGKTTPQIFFSVLLLGITILSFLTLYRNLSAHQKLANIKNEFISNITHELKTPIATVSVAIEALKSFNAMEDPAKTREYLEISQNELQRLSLLVDKVLKLSMFENKEIELKIETVDLKLLVEEVAASMRLQLEKQKANLSISSSGDTKVEGDRLHFMSVIYNLLDNALKYGKTSPSIEIDIKDSGEKAELSVADNGIGIPVEYKEKIFEKFFRVPSGNLHNAKGYGLGLSYVAHVVNKHQGEIAVESQPGVGSRFIIKIPKSHG